jgi:hypothetical protein
VDTLLGCVAHGRVTWLCCWCDLTVLCCVVLCLAVLWCAVLCRVLLVPLSPLSAKGVTGAKTCQACWQHCRAASCRRSNGTWQGP